MKKFLLAALVCLPLLSCSSDDSGSSTTFTETIVEKTQAGFKIKLFDDKGKAVAGSKVTGAVIIKWNTVAGQSVPELDRSSALQGTTDENGIVSFNLIKEGKYQPGKIYYFLFDNDTTICVKGPTSEGSIISTSAFKGKLIANERNCKL